jgi:hypothetical protein
MICRNCNEPFSNRITIDGITHNIQRRKFCLKCSPFKAHNTKPSLKIIISDCNIKTCLKCKLEKPLSDFYLKKKNNQIYPYCKNCSNIASIKRQQQNKINAVIYKGGKCTICGYDKCMNSLDFHHLDPEQKEFSISNHKNKSLENIKDELDKCILVCRNCHGELHAYPQLQDD